MKSSWFYTGNCYRSYFEKYAHLFFDPNPAEELFKFKYLYVKEVGRVWKNGNSSAVILPQDIAKRYELDKATNILIIPQKDGILIKKLRLP